jgi:cytochrome oxidase Cu insertion factor (SCO1/SenC/PrrC family)
MVRRLQLVTLALLGVSAILVAATWKWGNVPELDHFGSVAPFSFVGRDGKAVSDRDLSGHVCVFACFFTCCTESCPALSGSMARLQSELKDVGNLRLVSFTVDPENDTPEKLDAYAQTFGADPKRWLFLTSNRSKVEEFVVGRLKLGLEENKGPERTAGNKMLHSSKLILIDQKGEIRGYFDGTAPDGVDALEHAVRHLASQR